MSDPRAAVCAFCTHVHEPECDGFLAPAWALQRNQETLWCGWLRGDRHCGRRPQDHLHTPYCANGFQDKHHEWQPMPGSLAAFYADHIELDT